MRSLRSLHPLQSLWVTSGGKGAGRMARRREFDPCAAYQPLEYFCAAGRAKGAGRTTRSRKCNPCAAYSHWTTCGQQRARGAGPGAENATPAQPTAIGTIEGSWGRQGRGAQGQEQKVRSLRSLRLLEQFCAAGGAGAGPGAENATPRPRN